ncbi:PREDICTED: uncharacterized protein LOC108566470 [Nicrophorus vespilloides]|uniref:Uncharacterized protein LOC108566470 n=1 Tax=Nicrophorus vespilloides TaxID=110193 RepID=A0ABM1N4V6_NICVS|nr:PREDICTED: uncharacterized protein LOC108566470 [Nicrophorus vespilloides]
MTDANPNTKEPEEPPCAKVADVILNPSGLDKRRDTFQRKQDLRKVSSTPNLGRRLTSRRISGKIPLPNIEKKINNSERRTSGQNYRESLISGRMSDRRTAFMDNNINRYQEMLQFTDDKLSEAIHSMPFAKYDQWIKKSDINPLLLVFKDL